MTDVSRIRSFLIQLPKPAAIRVNVDGEQHEMLPGKSYQKTAESIAALSPQLIELFDADKRMLRAMNLDDEESRRSDAAPIPAGIAQDPHALMITHFANLLHRAYEHSTEIAFGKLVDLTDRLNNRSEAIEQRLERSEAQYRRLANEQIESALDRAEEAQQAQRGDIGEQMLGAFLGGRGEAGSPAAQPRKPNGRHD